MNLTILQSLHTWQLMLALMLLPCADACSVYDPSLVADVAAGAYGQAGRAGLGTAADGVTAADCLTGSGTCTRPNATTTCVEGICLIVSCDSQYLDCDEQAHNGCESDVKSVQHCGMCRGACRFNHAAASCVADRCIMGACDADYADCDGNPQNGCERYIASASDCGACNAACVAPPHSVPVCTAGRCGSVCTLGFGDCNGVAADGCELPLTDPVHCGGCNTRCKGSHVADAECSEGKCVVTRCEPAYGDCNVDASDGCELALTDAQNCGACSSDCALPHALLTRCDAQRPSSNAVAALCLLDTECGVNELDCVSADKNPCASGYADCDERPGNGCEADLRRLSSCGACGVSCVVRGAITACRAGRCVTLGCADGYDTCAGGAACESLLDDPRNCGACGTRCAGGMRCIGGRCTPLNCPPGRADCDGITLNQCESSLLDPAQCGGCGIGCPALPRTARVSCERGTCAVGTCEAGYADCDADPSNGCEVDLNTFDDCGACGASCVLPHAEATACVDAQCQP
ncbi:MAG: hypothetical protein RL701_2790, partial [Pseudomonadota bacterium]